MTDGAPCPRCAATRTWWLPYMGEFPPRYWCVACARTFAPAPLPELTGRQADYVTVRGNRAPAGETLPLWEDD